MKLFEIPIFVASVFGLCLLPGVDAPPAYADFTLGPATNLGPPVNGPLQDSLAWVSADGLSFLFARRANGSVPWEALVATRTTVQDPWQLGASLGVWGPDAALLSLRSAGLVPGVTTSDGLQAYLCFSDSEQLGGYGGYDLWMTKREKTDANWRPLVNLGPTVNSPNWDLNPSISPDGLELYFASNRPGGSGSFDLWVAKRATLSDPWGPPVNLGPTVNSPNAEYQPSISSDGLVLFFASGPASGSGPDDIWVTRRATEAGQWGTRVKLGPTVNTAADDFYPVISADGSTVYYTSDRPGGYGSYDIWQAPIIPIVDFNGDGKVDGKEVLAMAKNWGQNKSLYDIGPWPTGDGVVDANDLTVLARYIGQEANDPTLIARWALDETGGMTAHDSVGKNDAFVMGNAVWQPNGKVGGALAFDGKDDFLRSGSCVLDPSSGPFSVIAWVKGGAANRVIMSQFGGADWLYLNQYGMLTTDLKSSRKDGKALTSDAYVLDDQWHRVVLTWDGTNRTLQTDGAEVARDTQPNLAASTGSLQIGGGKNLATSTLWTGLMDDVRVYNRAVAP